MGGIDYHEHWVKGDKYSWYYCPDCDREYDIVNLGYDEWTEGHDWDWDLETPECRWCGQLLDCDHANMEDCWGSRPWEEGVKYTKAKALDYFEHQVTGPYFTWQYCPDCDQEFNVVNQGTQTFTEGHDYDYDLATPKCRVCSKKLDCKHKNMEHGEGSRPWEAEYEMGGIDYYEHWVKGDYYTWDYCPDCGQEFNLENLGYREWTEGHDWDWEHEEYPECRWCGQLLDCDHAEATEVVNVFYWWDGASPKEKYTLKSLDEGRHKVTGYKYTYTYCPTCDQVLTDPVRSSVKESWVEDHRYDDEGVCVLCKHKNTCKHAGAVTWETGSSLNCAYESLGEEQHHVAGPRRRITYCWACHTILEDEQISEYDEWEEGHAYDENGVCWLCGQVSEHQYTLTANAAEQLNVGDYLYIDIGDETVESFKSSKPAVASVAMNGRVEALSEGKANITVKLGSGKSLKLTLTVVDPTMPKKLTLSTGTKVTLDLTDDPLEILGIFDPDTAEGGITWTPVDKKAVSDIAIDDMQLTLTPKAVGSVKITAVANKNPKKAKATVTVTIKDLRAVKSIKFVEKTSQKLDVGGTLTLQTPIITGVDKVYEPRQDLIWENSDPTVVSFDDQTLTITALEGGRGKKAKITCYAVDANGQQVKGKKATMTISVNK